MSTTRDGLLWKHETSRLQFVHETRRCRARLGRLMYTVNPDETVRLFEIGNLRYIFDRVGPMRFREDLTHRRYRFHCGGCKADVVLRFETATRLVEEALKASPEPNGDYLVVVS